MNYNCNPYGIVQADNKADHQIQNLGAIFNPPINNKIC